LKDILSGTAGLGAESVVHLAKHNPAAIYFSGRSASSAKTVIERVKATTPNANLVFVECDLTSLVSVKAAAERILAESDRLDVLMCNAGIMATPPSVTTDGYEVQFGTNHLGHALLIKKLLPLLLRTNTRPETDVRVVILTSTGFIAHPTGGITFDTLKSPQDFGAGGPWVRYGQSKLANILYARELARRHPEITSLSIHPGVVKTNLVNGLGGANKFMVKLTNPRGLLEPEEGAYNQIWGAFGDRTNIQNGQMYEPVGQLYKKLDKTSKDDDLAKRLWEWTDEALKDY
jgi:NAD(P)-dependent dehydrogenase (short-subunit alcohol dehydrogenase family)